MSPTESDPAQKSRGQSSFEAPNVPPSRKSSPRKTRSQVSDLEDAVVGHVEQQPVRGSVESPDGRPIPPRQIYPGYSSDEALGEDLLDVQDEVDALCVVLTSKQLRPPLTVGLFGSWGSGKSFFMQLMRNRIDVLARKAREQSDEQTSTCRDIRQIVFNAWEFADTNLWASLATQVFRGLAPGDRSLSSGEEIEQELRQAYPDLFKESERLQGQVDRAHHEHEAAQEALRAADAEVGALQSSLLGKITSNLKEQGGRAESIAGNVQSLAETGSFLARLVGTWKALSPETRKRTLVRSILVAIPLAVLAALIGWLVTSNSEVVTALTGLVVAVFGFLSKWIGPLAAVSSTGKDLVERIEKRDALSQQVRRSQERVSLAQNEIRGFAAGPLLPRFIQDRSTAWATERQLGVIARIREDFRRLNELLLGDGEAAAALRGSLDRESLPQIDRVIVYVDDLDRCRPDVVVHVLESVHLLMGFPLFVVVVGVDCRWLLRSLERHYSEILTSPDATEGREEQPVPGGERKPSHFASTPQDYLEKIFQIPYTVPPMDAHGYGALVGELFATEDERRQATQDHPHIEVNPESLEIRPWELAFIRTLSPLVATPRATKRLVNVYRMIRVSTEAQGDEFCGSGPQQIADYQAVLILLGVLIGFPHQASYLFASLADQPENVKWRTWNDVVEGLTPSGTPNSLRNDLMEPGEMTETEATAWHRLKAALLRVETGVSELEGGTFAFVKDLDPFRRWVGSVARFSFEPERYLPYRGRSSSRAAATR